MKVLASLLTTLCLALWLGAAATADTITVHVVNFTFTPNVVTINRGDTIHWVWDNSNHSSTAVAHQTEQWDSTILSSGSTFDHTFTTIGTSIYYCRVHGHDNGDGTASGMSGMIIVADPNPIPTSLTFNPTSVVGGLTSTGTVTLDTPAPTGGTVVNLASDNAVATVPLSVTVAAGQSTADFTVTTTSVTTTTTANISAAANGTTISSALTVTPDGIQSVTVNPNLVTGGKSTQGTVTLQAPAAPGDITVNLSSSSTVATVPATITIPAGQSSGSFTISTTSVTSSTSVTITANVNGTSQSASLTVTPVALKQVKFKSKTVKNGKTAKGTVSLNMKAPTGGVFVTLTSSNSSIVAVPAGVTVLSGKKSVTFIGTTTAGVKGAVTITATALGSTVSTTLTVK